MPDEGCLTGDTRSREHLQRPRPRRRQLPHVDATPYAQRCNGIQERDHRRLSDPHGMLGGLTWTELVFSDWSTE